MANTLETLGRRVIRRIQDHHHHTQRERRRARVEAILSRTEPPEPCDSDELFEQLQAEYSPRDGYGYDPFSNWWRGVRRTSWLLPLAQLQTPGARILEAACGDGMTGFGFAGYGHQVTLHDLEDWRDDRAKSLPFVSGDLCEPLPLEPDSFDLVFSYNAFEHVTDPGASLMQLVRLCKPGGTVFLDFGPLYASPWGLHAYRTMYMPYPQFLFSQEYVERKLRALGVHDLGRAREDLQPLNRWRAEQFRATWRESGCTIAASNAKEDLAHLDVIETFPDSFQGRSLTFEDVTVTQISVCLRKPPHA